MKIGVVAAAVLLNFLLSSPSQAEIELETRTLLSGKLSLLVPKSFTRMSSAMLRVKYPSQRRPTIVFTDPEGLVNVAVNHTKNAVLPHQLAEARVVMERTLKGVHPTAEWKRSEITEINGRPFMFFDLRTAAIDTEVRNLMAATSFEGRLLFVSFNCTRELEPQWTSLGERILHSVRLEP